MQAEQLTFSPFKSFIAHILVCTLLDAVNISNKCKLKAWDKIMKWIWFRCVSGFITRIYFLLFLGLLCLLKSYSVHCLSFNHTEFGEAIEIIFKNKSVHFLSLFLNSSKSLTTHSFAASFRIFNHIGKSLFFSLVPTRFVSHYDLSSFQHLMWSNLKTNTNSIQLTIIVFLLFFIFYFSHLFHKNNFRCKKMVENIEQTMTYFPVRRCFFFIFFELPQTGNVPTICFSSSFILTFNLLFSHLVITLYQKQHPKREKKTHQESSIMRSTSWLIVWLQYSDWMVNGKCAYEVQ